MNLYRVTLSGTESFFISYAIAKDTEHAYRIVRTWFDQKNYGFYSDRTLKKVELIAESLDSGYVPDCGTRLFIEEK